MNTLTIHLPLVHDRSDSKNYQVKATLIHDVSMQEVVVNAVAAIPDLQEIFGTEQTRIARHQSHIHRKEEKILKDNIA